MVRTSLIADDHRHTQKIGIRRGRLREASVGAADNQVVDGHRLYVFANDGAGIQVIDRHAEESLNLRAMQIHGQHSVSTRRFYGVRTDSSANGHPRLVLFVSLGIAEVRNHGRDMLSTGPFQSVNPKQQFDKIVVHWVMNALNDKCVPPADVFQNADEYVPFAENLCLARRQTDSQTIGDFLRKDRVARSGQGSRDHPAEPENAEVVDPGDCPLILNPGS